MAWTSVEPGVSRGSLASRSSELRSQKHSNSEWRYPVHQLEFLALKWVVVDKFHDYLYIAKFVVRIDNKPLTYVLTSARLNITGHCWLAVLATY